MYCSRVGNGDVDVRNAVDIIDVLANDVSGTRQSLAASPERVVWRVDKLRRRLREAGAAADVTTHIALLHDLVAGLESEEAS